MRSVFCVDEFTLRDELFLERSLIMSNAKDSAYMRSQIYGYEVDHVEMYCDPIKTESSIVYHFKVYGRELSLD